MIATSSSPCGCYPSGPEVHVFSHIGVIEQSGDDMIGQAIAFANEVHGRHFSAPSQPSILSERKL